MKRIATLLGLVLALALPVAVSAQTAVTQTTLSAAVTSNTQKTITLASSTGVTAGSGLFVDMEAMVVNSINTTSNVATVTRGADGTDAANHASSAVVYAGPTSGVLGAGPFWMRDPSIGSCTASTEQYSLRINVHGGRIWQCTNSVWMNVIDAYLWVDSTACNSSVSGNSTGTNGATVVGTAPSLPVVQAQTSASSTNTHYFVCSIPPPSRLNTIKASYVVDAEFYYGVQTTGLGTQVATLASGTMNSKTVFQKIVYPVPGASETATGLTEAVRADAGTLLINPVVASFNVATTTAGEFYSVKFTPATPIAMATDHQQLFLVVSLLNTATSATITNSPGFLVHYRTLSIGI